MAVRAKQIGWSTEANILHDIIKELDQLIKVASKISSFNGTGDFTIIDNAIVPYTEQSTKALPAHNSAVTGQSSLMSPSELANGESVYIEVRISGKRDSNNTGFFGTYGTGWTKAGGTIQQIGEEGASLTNDMGGSVTVSTSDDGSGGLNISLTNNLTANCSWSWTATLTFKKAT